MSPIVQMLVSVGLVGFFAATTPAGLAKIQSLPILNQLIAWWNKPKVDPIPKPVPSPSPISVPDVHTPESGINNPVDAHTTITALMAYFARHQDQIGIELTAKVGQHVYERCVKCMGTKVKSVTKSSATEESK